MTTDADTDLPTVDEAEPYQLLPPLTEDEFTNLKEDIKRKGVLVPVEFDEDGAVLDGHHRLRVVRELEAEGYRIKYDSIIRRGLTEDQKFDHVLTLNLKRRHLSHETRSQIFTMLRSHGATISAIAEASGASTATVWRVLDDAGADAPKYTTGKDGKLYPTQFAKRVIFSSEDADRKAKRDLPQDEVPTLPTVEPTTKVGDVWALGPHRLLCGSSTDPNTVSRLFPSGASATLLVTSPPYWVGKEYEQEHTEDEINAHIAAACEAWQSAIAKPGRIVINTNLNAGSHWINDDARYEFDLLLPRWQERLRSTNWLMRSVRIWAKEGPPLNVGAGADISSQYWEFLATFYYADSHIKRRVPNSINTSWCMSGVWNVGPESSAGGVSAPFPVEIPGRFIELYTSEGDVVFDPYLGTGTTLIPAEHRSRICYGVELNPSYCDVIVNRWQNLTGKTATRSNVGKSLAV